MYLRGGYPGASGNLGTRDRLFIIDINTNLKEEFRLKNILLIAIFFSQISYAGLSIEGHVGMPALDEIQQQKIEGIVFIARQQKEVMKCSDLKYK